MSEKKPLAIYDAVLPNILKQLEAAMSSDDLAKILNVNKGLLNIWLKKAVCDGCIKKHSRPVRYETIKTNMSTTNSCTWT
ncbi:MAG: hypothetical protein JRJ62_14620 [Deltaproteobacteria bacterium]|nr:hypothetical protein [Deltaproteobacteria bacterium]MBW2104895.1 hypothetical protein [Deltaproteobacteria bacterium]